MISADGPDEGDAKTKDAAVSSDEILRGLHAPDGDALLWPTSTEKAFLFTYDLLLDQTDMSRRVKGMRPAKIVKVVNFRLDWPWYFPPMETALPSLKRTNDEADCVWGLLYHATGIDLSPLDDSLKVPRRYHRRDINVTDRGGRRIKAFTYVLSVSSAQPVYPSTKYRDQLIAAAKERDLPAEWIAKLRVLTVS